MRYIDCFSSVPDHLDVPVIVLCCAIVPVTQLQQDRTASVTPL